MNELIYESKIIIPFLIIEMILKIKVRKIWKNYIKIMISNYFTFFRLIKKYLN